MLKAFAEGLTAEELSKCKLSEPPFNIIIEAGAERDPLAVNKPHLKKYKALALCDLAFVWFELLLVGFTGRRTDGFDPSCPGHQDLDCGARVRVILDRGPNR